MRSDLSQSFFDTFVFVTLSKTYKFNKKGALFQQGAIMFLFNTYSASFLIFLNVLCFPSRELFRACMKDNKYYFSSLKTVVWLLFFQETSVFNLAGFCFVSSLQVLQAVSERVT